jgi:hypothetical protein
MLLWLSILFILIITFTIYWFYLRKKNNLVKEKFQNQYDENSPPINVNVTVSPTLLESAREQLSQTPYEQDESGRVIPATDANMNNRNCLQLQNSLNNYNSELQRHRDEGNWNHTHAVKSYINIIKEQLIASACPTN